MANFYIDSRVHYLPPFYMHITTDGYRTGYFQAKQWFAQFWYFFHMKVKYIDALMPCEYSIFKSPTFVKIQDFMFKTNSIAGTRQLYSAHIRCVLFFALSTHNPIATLKYDFALILQSLDQILQGLTESEIITSFDRKRKKSIYSGCHKKCWLEKPRKVIYYLISSQIDEMF